jgi:hypothetical protein
MSGAAMPKTTIYENRDAFAAKDKIRTTRKRLMAAPPLDTVRTEN